MSKGFSYAEAGVNIDEGNRLIEMIKPFARSTARKGADGALGGFGGIFDLKAIKKFKDPVLVSGTDGVGTKLKLAQELGIHDTIGIDLVAMCVNDIVVHGAEPLFFLDYFATGKLDNKVAASVIKGIAKGCKMAGCALIGGETAEMPGMYKPGEYDLAGFSVGAVERRKLLPKKDIKAGDILIGLPSSGLHSNGFSLVNHILEKKGIDSRKAATFSTKELGAILLEPTAIYVEFCLGLLGRHKIKAFAHITGGGLLENVPRILPAHLAAKIDCYTWRLPSLFKWLKAVGKIDSYEMLKTFNCGIGMVMVVSRREAEKISNALKLAREPHHIIGRVVQRKNEKILFTNLKHFDEA